MAHLHLSFSAAGFLGMYQLGAAQALHLHGQPLLREVVAFAGASAGSLVACVLLTAPDRIQDCARFTHGFAQETRQQVLGALSPGYDFMARLRSGMEFILPPDAHWLAQHRLHVSVTCARTRTNRLVSHFPSRDDLIQVLLASSFVPIYAGLKPMEYQGQRWVDGGLSNSLPILPRGRTVTVSPFCGQTDIGPQDPGNHRGLHVCLARQHLQLSLANLKRLRLALFPPGPRDMEALHHSGFQDALSFLRREQCFQPGPHSGGS